MDERRLVRPLMGRKIAGVCMAVANFFGLDVTHIRLVWALCIILGGSGLLAYLIAWIIIPEENACCRR